MKRCKIKSKDINKETGLTKVTITTPIGEFIGFSKYIEDNDEFSENLGIAIAYMKALRKYYRATKRIYKVKAKAMQEFLNQITDMKECDAFSKEGTKAYKMMKEYLNYANGAESAISLIDHICYSYSHGTEF